MGTKSFYNEYWTDLFTSMPLSEIVTSLFTHGVDPVAALIEQAKFIRLIGHHCCVCSRGSSCNIARCTVHVGAPPVIDFVPANGRNHNWGELFVQYVPWLGARVVLQENVFLLVSAKDFNLSLLHTVCPTVT